MSKNMSKNITYLISVLLIGVVYNVAFFLLKSSDLNLSGWVAYGFTDLAILLLAVIPFVEPSNSNTGSNMATWLCLAIYTAIVLFFGIVIIAVNPINYKWVIVVELILLCVSIILTMTNIKLNKQSNMSR